jgi:arylsulfatase A-like enzyme
VTAGAVVTLVGVWWTVRADQGPVGVVIITLDTTRADRLSPYGFMDVSLPALERLAREGVVFDQATTTVPLTLPAHTSLFTGLLPPNHGVRDNADEPVAASIPTLAETLLARGFRTGASVGSVVLGPERGLQRGFEVYRSVPPGDPLSPESRQRRGDDVISDAVQFLDSVGESPFFLWAHLYDAHRPYSPPEPFRTTYAHDLYLGEIAFADSQIGRLLDALERRHVLDRTVIVVTSDHGESLGEHGERDHGVFVYESVLHVPLIVRAPRLLPGRVPSVVRMIDVMPTVLDLLHIPAPPSDGVSLARAMAGQGSARDLPAYAESLYPERLGWSPLHALREGRFKLIDAPRPELYDLDADPFEQTDIYGTHRDLAEAMRGRAAALTHGRPDRTATEGASPDLQANLRTLGYLAGPMRAAPSPGTSRPDPKDCVGGKAAHPGVAPIAGCGPWAALNRR